MHLGCIFRHIPVDMAAFGIHINLFIQKPEVRVGFVPGRTRRSKKGFMESDLIKGIGKSRDQIECRGVSNEVWVVYVRPCTYVCVMYNYSPPAPRLEHATQYLRQYLL